MFRKILALCATWASAACGQPLTLVKDVNTATSSQVGPLATSGAYGMMYVQSSSDPTRTLWVTDGTVAGTLPTALPPPESYHLGSVGRLFVVATGTTGLWAYDPHVGDAKRLAPVAWDAMIFGESVFYADHPYGSQTRYWRVDPLTAEGPELLPASMPYPAQSAAILLNGTIYYPGPYDPATGLSELWAYKLAGRTAHRVQTGISIFYPLLSVGPYILNLQPIPVSRSEPAWGFGRFDIRTEQYDVTPFEHAPNSSVGLPYVAFGRFNVESGITVGHSSVTAVQGFDPTTGMSFPLLTPAGYPGDFGDPAVLGDAIYFNYRTSAVGRELFRLRVGSTAPELVADVRPGTSDSMGGWGYVYPRAMAGRVWFKADNGISGQELWMHDPASNTTSMVRDVFPGPTGSAPTILGAVGDIVLFTADDGVHGTELWRSDGTSAGTYILRDFQAGTDDSSPDEFRRFGERLMFAATNADGRRLYVSDGTPSGTVPLSPLTQYNFGGFHPAPFRNGMAFMLPTNPASGLRMYFTDGTPSGTAQVGTLTANIGSCGDSFLAAGSDYLMFGGRLSVPCEPWISDLTPAGTHPLLAIYPASGSDPALYARCAGLTVFSATDQAHGTELWTTNGTAAGTRLLADLWPGPSNSYPEGFAVLHDRLYFLATTPAGPTLYVADPRAGTTVAIFSSPNVPINVTGLLAVGDRIIMGISLGDQPNGVYSYSPDSGVFRRVASAAYAGPAAVQYPGEGPLVDPTGLLYFGTNDTYGTSSVYVYDSVTDEVRRLRTAVTTLSGNSQPSFLTSFRSHTFMSLDDGIHGHELWVTDGTAEGTRLYADLVPGPVGSHPRAALAIGDRLYVSCTTLAYGSEVYYLPLCAADFNFDGGITVEDLLDFLGAFASGSIIADLDDGTGSATPDGGVTLEDLLFFLFHFADGC